MRERRHSVGQQARADGATRRNFELLDGWICTWPRARKSRLKPKMPVIVTNHFAQSGREIVALGVWLDGPLAIRVVGIARRTGFLDV